MKMRMFAAALLVAAVGCQSAPSGGTREVQVAVTEKGFEPSEIHVKKGETVVLAITRRTERTCATDVVVGDGKTPEALPLDQTVRLPLGKVNADVSFACGMGMYKGSIIAD